MTTTHTTSPTTRVLGSLALVAALGLLGTACGDDDADAGAAPTPETTAAPAEQPVPAEQPEPETLTVVLEDFAFADLPASVPAGTRLTVVNEAQRELHELVAVRLPDDEQRSAEELVHDPAALEEVLTAGPPAAVLLAAPGGEAIPAVGDGTLSEPGRYLIVCMIPSGVEPAVYLEAAAQSGGAPPQVDGGPPHVAHGMFAELVVE
ncbi:hypothetical protein [Actinomarinicola tropica]|uniref:hypothetical protein n=1 Tax=Actinomarinicola tropica TaxID=2789776 RepID=UPI001899435E|nr:hypothetical protein [Actinomarinicola tropica]